MKQRTGMSKTTQKNISRAAWARRILQAEHWGPFFRLHTKQLIVEKWPFRRLTRPLSIQIIEEKRKKKNWCPKPQKKSLVTKRMRWNLRKESPWREPLIPNCVGVPYKRTHRSSSGESQAVKVTDLTRVFPNMIQKILSALSKQILNKLWYNSVHLFEEFEQLLPKNTHMISSVEQGLRKISEGVISGGNDDFTFRPFPTKIENIENNKNDQRQWVFFFPVCTATRWNGEAGAVCLRNGREGTQCGRLRERRWWKPWNDTNSVDSNKQTDKEFQSECGLEWCCFILVPFEKINIELSQNI